MYGSLLAREQSVILVCTMGCVTIFLKSANNTLPLCSIDIVEVRSGALSVDHSREERQRSDRGSADRAANGERDFSGTQAH